jgi:hypothetical protein
MTADIEKKAMREMNSTSSCIAFLNCILNNYNILIPGESLSPSASLPHRH